MEIPPEVTSFCELARNYCSWAEQPPGAVPHEVDRALGFLSSLYSLALKLPGAKPEHLQEQEDSLGKNDTEFIYGRFTHMPFRHYSEFFNPCANPPEEPVTCDLADDLRDIYAEMMNGL